MNIPTEALVTEVVDGLKNVAGVGLESMYGPLRPSNPGVESLMWESGYI